jgi:hypothetical protein
LVFLVEGNGSINSNYIAKSFDCIKSEKRGELKDKIRNKGDLEKLSRSLLKQSGGLVEEQVENLEQLIKVIFSKEAEILFKGLTSEKVEKFLKEDQDLKNFF